MEFFSNASILFGGRFSVFVIIMWHILINVAASSLSFYLAFTLADFDTDLSDGSEKSHKNIMEKSKNYVIILLSIMSSCILITIIGKAISAAVFVSINKKLHSRVIEGLMNTNMRFFDENTSGRILNRLSSDVAVVDLIVFSFLDMIDYIIKCTFSVAFIVYSSPFTLIVVILQLCYFAYLRKTILNITRECFRMK